MFHVKQEGNGPSPGRKMLAIALENLAAAQRTDRIARMNHDGLLDARLALAATLRGRAREQARAAHELIAKERG